jgi:hypothetical protein
MANSLGAGLRDGALKRRFDRRGSGAKQPAELFLAHAAGAQFE